MVTLSDRQTDRQITPTPSASLTIHYSSSCKLFLYKLHVLVCLNLSSLCRVGDEVVLVNSGCHLAVILG